ncbi:DnaJ family domain-containing protein [Oceanobacillus sp. 1P07AA]|uniref:DnaJ family domain-containing protein n=1 Tax=Oceanobacillus sp. 1P07AA TaxID=3132293 RepID=UPI0039A41F15
MDRKYNDLIGDILKESGEKDRKDLQGIGKPLPKDYVKRDVFQNFQKIAKDAGYLPYWLKLQKEIALQIHTITNEKELKKINKRIKEYNTVCPTSMQRSTITLEELAKAKKIW